MIEYKTFPFTFSGLNGATTEGIIRSYNHMNMHPDVVAILLKEFNHINSESLPAKMGKTVQIPVLLPFCGKHERGEQCLTSPGAGLDNALLGPMSV